MRGGLARDAQRLLAPYARRRTFGAGSLLWSEGDAPGMLVAIQGGRVKIFRVLSSGNAVTLFLFGPGDVFGFMPLLDGRPYPATAQALEQVTALVVSEADLRGAFERDAHVSLALVKLLASRLRDALDRVERASVPEVLPRVASALASLLPSETPPRRMVVIDLPVRAREFAGAIGVAAESFSRAITKLVGDGVLHRLGPRRYQVLDFAGLLRASSGTGSARDR
jgi:CRP/FNR family transcriptional regulator